MGEGSKNAETIVCVAFGASWTSKVIPQFEALFASRTRVVFLGCFRGLLGAFRSFSEALDVSKAISERLIAPVSGEGA